MKRWGPHLELVIARLSKFLLLFVLFVVVIVYFGSSKLRKGDGREEEPVSRFLSSFCGCPCLSSFLSGETGWKTRIKSLKN